MVLQKPCVYKTMLFRVSTGGIAACNVFLSIEHSDILSKVLFGQHAEMVGKYPMSRCPTVISGSG